MYQFLCSGVNPVSCSAGLRRPGHEADLPSPGSAKVKNGWIYTSINAVCCHDVYKYKFALYQTAWRELKTVDS